MYEIAFQVAAAQEHIGKGRFVLGVVIAAAGLTIFCAAIPRRNGEGHLGGMGIGFALVCIGCLISFYHNK